VGILSAAIDQQGIGFETQLPVRLGFSGQSITIKDDLTFSWIDLECQLVGLIALLMLSGKND
jgi:hypothetical protein